MENAPREYQNKVSIIIPCRTIDADTLRCMSRCESLPQDKEIIAVTDEICPGLPADKRNWGMERAVGNILAFIDSDAYPGEHWLVWALYYLRCFPAVCGPGVIPPDSSLLERATDLVYRWMPFAYRVRPGKMQIVPEFPTFNLLVYHNIAPKFKPYLTGEDSLFCREISGPIFYSPDILVYHKRRPLFRPLWKQVATYGTHRGHLIRLAILGWITVGIVYAFNFIKGFCKKKI